MKAISVFIVQCSCCIRVRVSPPVRFEGGENCVFLLDRAIFDQFWSSTAPRCKRIHFLRGHCTTYSRVCFTSETCIVSKFCEFYNKKKRCVVKLLRGDYDLDSYVRRQRRAVHCMYARFTTTSPILTEILNLYSGLFISFVSSCFTHLLHKSSDAQFTRAGDMSSEKQNCLQVHVRILSSCFSGR